MKLPIAQAAQTERQIPHSWELWLKPWLLVIGNFSSDTPDLVLPGLIYRTGRDIIRLYTGSSNNSGEIISKTIVPKRSILGGKSIAIRRPGRIFGCRMSIQ